MGTSSRWSPTPEQLYALEEMYQSGIRTPSVNQIQEIAVKLSYFGRIEGKNVFYWFQNHKAREKRQRYCRLQQLNSSSLTKKPQLRVNTGSLKRKTIGFSRPGFELEDWLVKPLSFRTLSEESQAMPRAMVPENVTNEYIQFEERKLQQKSGTSCCKIAKQRTMEFSSSYPTKAQNINTLASNKENGIKPEDEREYPTLELFPLRNDGPRVTNASTNDSVTIKTNKFTALQFLEFLSLKR